jgi:hypothetical protein
VLVDRVREREPVDELEHDVGKRVVDGVGEQPRQGRVAGLGERGALPAQGASRPRVLHLVRSCELDDDRVPQRHRPGPPGLGPVAHPEPFHGEQAWTQRRALVTLPDGQTVEIVDTGRVHGGSPLDGGVRPGRQVRADPLMFSNGLFSNGCANGSANGCGTGCATCSVTGASSRWLT